MYASVSHVRDTRKRETRIHSEDRYRRFLRRAEHVGNAIGARRGIYELLITPNAFRIISHAQGFRYSVARLSSAAATTAFNFSSIASNENRLGNPFPFFFFFVFLLFPLAEEIRDFFAKFSRHPITAVTLSSAEIIDLFFRARANESLGNYGTSSDSSQRYTRRALEFQAAGLQEKWISMLTQKPRMTARSHSECVTWT